MFEVKTYENRIYRLTYSAELTLLGDFYVRPWLQGAVRLKRPKDDSFRL